MPVTYRKLNLDELKMFHQEFAEYLAVNGIDADFWEKIKKEDTEKTNKILDEFSNVIFNSILLKMEYVQFVTQGSAKYFYYGKEKAVLIGLEGKEIDFRDRKSILEGASNGIKYFKTEKKYTKNREVELFEMLRNGCEPFDGKLFKDLIKTFF